jgi:hypothetical protein
MNLNGKLRRAFGIAVRTDKMVSRHTESDNNFASGEQFNEHAYPNYEAVRERHAS